MAEVMHAAETYAETAAVALSRLLDSAYAASTEHGRWPAFLREAAQLIGADSVHVCADGSFDLAGLGLQHGFSPEDLERYRRRYLSSDPWRRPAEALAPGRSAVVRGELLVDDGELFASEAYRDFFAPLGVRWCIGCAVAPALACSPLYVVRFFRSAAAGPFGADAEFIVGEIGRHLLRVERLAAALVGWRTAQGAGGSPAALVLSATGQLLQCDQHGAALLAAGALRRAGPRLRFASVSADAWLTTALAALPGKGGARRQVRQAGVVAPGVSSEIELVVVAQPCSSPLMLAARFLLRIATVRECTREQAAREASGRFGWTEAEFDVALRLGNGGTIAAIATARGTTLDTVRSHVKSIKRKTGVRRAADLIRVIAELTDGLRVPE